MPFFETVDAQTFRATEHCAGPWDAKFQHGGPPSALLARAVERLSPRDDMVVARMTVEILGPIPVDVVEVAADVVRPGRSVELVAATLSSGGREVLRASAWRVRRTEGVSVPSRVPAIPSFDESTEHSPAVATGYLAAIEWRWVRGHLDEPGPATVWGRMRHPLVDGEEPSGLQRVMALADSGNGVSSELDWQRWYFINPELTVHLHREPVGEWMCLDAVTTVSEGGAGLATSVLRDSMGSVGVGAQSLYVGPR